MSDYKIIFTGPTGAGKSTAIAALSDVPPVKTEAKSKEAAGYVGKTGITVALDYGILKLSDKDKVHLFGTPGQERFDFMWDILTEGGLGLVLLINNTRPNPLQDMEFFLNAFAEFIRNTKLAVGITRMDLQPTPTLEDFHQKLREHGLNPPLFEIDARTKNDVALLLQALLYSLDPYLKN
jgi:signal recognition particle receptor subunit beta